ncbi:MAG: hypothetical protein ACRDHO_02505 [Actinomycetota bacterium]
MSRLGTMSEEHKTMVAHWHAMTPQEKNEGVAALSCGRAGPPLAVVC